MSAVSIFYYFRLVTAMYLQPDTGRPGVVSGRGLRFVTIVCLIVTIVLGVVPARFIDEAGRSGASVSKRIADAQR